MIRVRRNSPSAARRRWLSIDRGQAERIARLELQLALDGLGVRVRVVADDEHVIDERSAALRAR